MTSPIFKHRDDALSFINEKGISFEERQRRKELVLHIMYSTQRPLYFRSKKEKNK